MVRDSNAPKRPLSAFFRFGADVRPQVTSEGFVGKAAGIEIGKRWAHVSQEQKEEYQREYEQEAVVWKEAFAAYKKTPLYEKFQAEKKAKKQKKSKKALKDPNRPKKAPTGYFLYCMDARPELKRTMEDTSMKAISQKLGEGWQNLSAEDKEAYVEKSAELKVIAQKKMEEYKQSAEYKEHQERIKELMEDSNDSVKALVDEVKPVAVSKRKVSKKKIQKKMTKKQQKAAALKAKKQAKKAALKAKKQAKKAREAAKKAALKAKKQAKKEREAAKKAAMKAKIAARKARAKQQKKKKGVSGKKTVKK